MRFVQAAPCRCTRLHCSRVCDFHSILVMHGVRMDVRSFAHARARVHELETTAHYVNRHEFRVPGRRGWSYAEFVDLGPVPIDVIVAQMCSVLRKSTRFRDVPLAQAHDHWRDAAMKGKGSPSSRLRQWTKEKVTCFLCIRVGLHIFPLLLLLSFLPSMYVSMLRIVFCGRESRMNYTRVSA